MVWYGILEFNVPLDTVAAHVVVIPEVNCNCMYCTHIELD